MKENFFIPIFSNRLTSSQLIAAITINVVLSWFLFAIVSWNVWSMYFECPESITKKLQLQDLSRQIIYYDEILTSSAQLAVTTNEPRLNKRYHRFATELNHIIDQFFQLASPLYKNYAQHIKTAHSELSRIESTVFDLIQQNRLESAKQLLFSKEYEYQKQIYNRNISRTLSKIQVEIDTQLNSYHLRLFLSSVFATTSLLVLILAGLTILRLILRYLRKRRQVEADLEQRVQARTVELAQAGMEILMLNEKLEAENYRLNAELDVTRQLQQMILPKREELEQIEELEIAGFMEPAEKVGGDYYDVLQHGELVRIGIGDVTGHGLVSGVVMLMVQTAIRTLLMNNVTDPKILLNVVNRTLYDNIQRMQSDKSMSLSLLDYHRGTLRLTGQHEEVLVVRKDGVIERIKTTNLGFPLGLEKDITHFISYLEISLQPGEGVVLYTDGITEALNSNKMQYGIKRLCEVISRHWQLSASEIQQEIVIDVLEHIGVEKIVDDMTLIILKQRAFND